MDWRTFVLDLVQALAWPVALVISATAIARAYRESFEEDEEDE